MITSPGSIPSCSCSARRSAVRRGAFAPPVKAGAQRVTAHRVNALVQKSGRTQFKHHLWHAACEKNLHCGKVPRAVGQSVHQARNLAIDCGPIIHRGPRQTRRMSNGRQMQQKIRRTAKRRMKHHGVANGGGSKNVARAHAPVDAGAAVRAPSGSPHRATQAGLRAQARCAAARAPALRPPPATVAAVPRNWHPPPGDAQARQPTSAAYSSVICFCAKRAPMVCTLPASSPDSGSSVTPPGTSTAGLRAADASAIIMAGSPLSHVATPMTPLPRWQRAHQPAQHHGSIVAEGQRVHHARGALGAAVAGVGAGSGERESRAADFSSRAASATSRPTSQWPV